MEERKNKNEGIAKRERKAKRISEA